jgi:Cof subfamily protein (haloacid dehalogenase superfamily)
MHIAMAGLYNVIACDLDGTLLNPDHRVGRFTIETIRAVVERGVNFVIATGRHLRECAEIRAQLGIAGDLITCNGARVHDAAEQVIYRSDLPVDVVRELVDPALARGCMINLYTDDEWLLSHHVPRQHDPSTETRFRFRLTEVRALAGEGIAKLFYIGEPSVLAEIERDLVSRFGDRVSLAFSLDDALEVTGAGVNKGRALSAMLEAKGVDPSACLAFGDGMNDIQMLQVAGKALLMGNAGARAREALPGIEIIGRNADEAMAHYVSQLYRL